MNEINTQVDPNLSIDLLGKPSHIIKKRKYVLYQWGWTGLNNLDQFVGDAEELFNYLINKSEGVFFVLIKNNLRKIHYFFSDRFSCKKVFYYMKGNKIYLSNFIFKFIPLLDIGKELDNISLALYLTYGYIPTNDTLYKNVKSLKPFTYYVYEAESLKEYPYSPVNFHESSMSYKEAASGIFNMLEKRYIEITKDFKKFLIPLSGGRDSRFLISLALKHFDKHQIRTFTFGQKGTYDYEIGKGFAKKYDLDSMILPFTVKNYYEDYIVPATPYKNGLLNHSIQSPAKFYEHVLGDTKDTAILSGFIGDAVFAWSHQKKVVRNKDGVLFPAPNHLSFNEVNELLSSHEKEAYYMKLKKIVDDLYNDENNLETEYWLYNVHVPFFTNPCMFSEEKDYPFVLPFIEREFFSFLEKIPIQFKKMSTFYEDILKMDQSLYSVFSYPLKNLRGYGYCKNRFSNWIRKYLLDTKAVFLGARPMKNYVDFKKAYSDKFLDKQIQELKKHDLMNRIISKIDDLSFKNKCLFLSLKLNLETFFWFR